MDALARDLRFAGRMLVREPGFTLLAILALALGIGATTAIFTVNLSEPVTDLANSNFGKVTSQLNTRAIQLGPRVRF